VGTELIGPDQLPDTIASADQHPVAVYLSRLAPRSQRTMLGALDRIARLLTSGQADARGLSWQRVNYRHARALRQRLSLIYAPATVNIMLAALRGVLKECWRLGLLDAEAYHLAADVKGVKGSRLPRGRALSTGELRALFAACADAREPVGVRDAAIFATLYAGGLRRSEAVALDLDALDPETGALRVLGKGDKERLVYLQNGARAAIVDWIEIRGAEPGPLFLRALQSGGFQLARLTDQAMLYILRRRCEQAGVAQASPHDLRRSFISDLLDAGADISTVQQLAGHANVSTTQRYDRRGEVVKLNASRLLHVPYGRRAS
jgi:integrase/recombinase XerD